MRRDVLRVLCAGLLGLSACAWGYGSGGDFTDAERALFVDAPRMFPIKKLGNYDPSNPAWFDEDRLIFSTGKTADGWRTRPKGSKDAPEPPKIVLLNVRTGVLEVTQYRGIMQCYADGNLVLTAHPDAQPDNGDSTPRPHRQGSKYWYGRFGEKLQRVPDEILVPGFSPVSCLPFWFESAQGERIETGVKRGPDVRYRYVPLRHEDGVLKIPQGKYITNSPLIIYRDTHGQETEIRSKAEIATAGMRYMPYTQQYLIGENHSGIFARFLLRKGELTPAPQSPLPIPGYYYTDLVRGGVVHAHMSDPAYWRRQGIYWVHNGKTYRLDDQNIVAVAGASVNGCRYAYSRSPGYAWDPGSSNNPSYNPDIVELVTINLCTEEK